ncbi:unnamed protein product, partial [Gulo gulo]
SLCLPSRSLISVSQVTSGPSSFLVLEDSILAGNPHGFSAPLSTFGKTPAICGPSFSFPECRSPPVKSNLKTGSPGLLPLLGLSLRRAMGVGRRLPECPAPPTAYPLALPRTDGLH